MGKLGKKGQALVEYLLIIAVISVILRDLNLVRVNVLSKK